MTTTETKIPSAAEIAVAKKELDEKIEFVREHAVAQINALVDSLNAIGLRYKLVKDGAPEKTKRRCGICLKPGHRAPQCPEKASNVA